jgi:Uma2 family endonuclease
MGMPIAHERRWSVEDVWALPEDGKRYETVDGELLVTPAPRYSHQAISGAIYRPLQAWVAEHRAGVVLYAPADVILDTFTLVQPDVLVLPPVSRAVMQGHEPAPAPLLVVEVLSPGTARQDRLRKRARYQRAGIECWLVDPLSELVERWTPESDRPEVCTERVSWFPNGSASAFTLELVPIWNEVGPPAVE